MIKSKTMKRDSFKLWMQFFAIIIIISLIIKLLNVNFDYTLLMIKIGFGGLLLSHLVYNLTKKEKKITDYIILIHVLSLATLWMFIRFNFPYQRQMMLVSGIIGTVWFLSLFRAILNFKDKKESLKNYLFITAALAVTIGAVFQIQHWPLGKELFYLGMGLALISMVIEFWSWIKK